MSDANKPKEGNKKERKQKNATGEGSKKPKDEQHQDASKQPKGGETGPKSQGKSKAELRAERRAIQEAQRAAKEQKTKDGGKGGAGKQVNVESKREQKNITQPKADEKVPIQSPTTGVEERRGSIKASTPITSVDKKPGKKEPSVELETKQKRVQLFSHLDQYKGSEELTKNISVSGEVIHPAIVSLGLKYAHGVMRGSNARCIALLQAFKQLIQDYSTPDDKEMLRDLDQKLKPQLTYLKQCRPLSVSMGNAVRFLKKEMVEMAEERKDWKESEIKEALINTIDTFINEKISFADRVILGLGKSKIINGDVILTYGYSSVIKKILTEAYSDTCKFHVIVVDSRPRFSGKQMLLQLANKNIKCTYVLINSVSYVMREVSKVFLGAHCLLANGSVTGEVGASQVALVAKDHNVPVLVCCESYKFCEKVQTDSIVVNELANPEEIAHTPTRVLQGWKDNPNLSLLNVTYDVTPADLVTAVITERGMIPCTAVPVVLRMMHDESRKNI